MLNFLKKLFGTTTPAVDYKALLKSGAIIVDVRTPGEFKSGHIKNSINIPLDQIKKMLPELKKKQKPIITCCRSGNRSGMAKSILTSAGVECYNGGAWHNLNAKLV